MILHSGIIEILVFLVWSAPLVFYPVFQQLSGRSPISIWKSYFVFVAVFAGVDAHLTNVPISDFLFLSPASLLYPLFAFGAFSDAQAFDMHIIYWLTVLPAALLFVSFFFVHGKWRLALAVFMPIPIVTIPAMVQSAYSMQTMMTRANEQGLECLSVQTLMASRKQFGFVRPNYHGIARSDEAYFNWSYGSGNWEEIPSSEWGKNYVFLPNGSCS